jgi:hypothetical protein
MALDSAQHKPLLWLWYVDDTLGVCPHDPEQLQNFLSHISSLRPSIQLTMQTEADSVILVLDVLVIKKKMTVATRVHRRSTHTGRYLNFRSNHPPHVKRGLIQSFHNRASTICQEQDLYNEIISLRRDLQLSGYRQGFIDLVITSKGISHPNKEKRPLGSVYIPYVKGVLEKFKHIGNRYNIRTIFKTKHTLRSSLMKPGWK